MKKIFAIALALVMVLSMASAFATYCNWDAWDCDSTTIRCGKATVEVVPYVRAATACGFEFASNGCAAAIKGENVYFAVKLTVDADVSEDWWNAATLSLKGTDVDATDWTTPNMTKPLYKDVKDGGVFYLKDTTAATVTDASSWANDVVTYGWDKEDADFTFGEKNVFSAKAAKSSAKVCATLKSVWAIETAKDKTHDWVDHKSLKIGDYTFEFFRTGNKNNGTDPKCIKVVKGTKEAWIVLDKDNKVDFVWVDADTAVAGNVKMTGYATTALNAYVDANGVEYGFTCNEGAFLKEVFDFLKVDFGTCMTDQGVSNNFGWNDEIKSCTAYKTAGMAVVDSECVVAIPKTGDASVLAWLF